MLWDNLYKDLTGIKGLLPYCIHCLQYTSVSRHLNSHPKIIYIKYLQYVRPCVKHDLPQLYR
jgi:hypothetical protein